VFYSIDDAMKTGYAWKYGPFENWDFVGVQKGIDLVESEGYKVADWVKEMLASGNESFYKLENGKQLFYNQNTKSYEPIPGQDAFIILNNIRKEKTVWSNSESALIDLGDGILNFEFRSKMNSWRWRFGRS
jgi:3-hydroxyacyl-CoA dehydrogenase